MSYLYPIVKYHNYECGYWLHKYALNSGTIERIHTLIDLNGTDFSGESYFTEPWFLELKKASGVRDFCCYTSGSVAQCTIQNSNFDNTFLNRHAHKELQPDILAILDGLAKGGAIDAQINMMLRDILKGVFDENAESFKRIWSVINKSYEPLYNVDVVDTEEHSGSDTTSHDGTDSKTTTGNIEDKKEGKETNKDGNNSHTTTNNGIFVFDSNSAIDDSTSETLLATEKELSFTNRKDTRTYNSLKDQTEYDSTLETEYDSTITRTKHGNQGITMSQEMLNAEIDTWTKIDFMRYVVDEVARVMLLY